LRKNAPRLTELLDSLTGDLLSRKAVRLIHQHRSAPMDAALQAQISIAALVCSIAALFFSLVAAFPGLKAVLAAIRDGVLWFSLFLVLGGVAFVIWQHVQGQVAGITAGNSLDQAQPVMAEREPQGSR
jgi:hypothetical protein